MTLMEIEERLRRLLVTKELERRRWPGIASPVQRQLVADAQRELEQLIFDLERERLCGETK